MSTAIDSVAINPGGAPMIAGDDSPVSWLRSCPASPPISETIKTLIETIRE